MNGGAWGVVEMTTQRSVMAPACLMLSDVSQRSTNARNQQAQKKQNSVAAHNSFWDSKYPGQYEHWRFANGWDIGFCDALAFFEMRSKNCLQGADKIGMLDL